MSWDLIVFKLTSTLTNPETGEAIFPDEWEPPEIGTPSQIRTQISEALPNVDWSDKSWGMLDGSDYSLEFNIGNETPITNFMIHARGNATPPIITLMSLTGWRIIDTVTGKWMHETSNPDEGREKFQSYMERVLKEPKPHKRPNFLKRLFKK